MKARKGVSPILTEKASVVSCAHHWIIEPPKGPVSRGVCKICRERREFQNAPLEGYLDSWERQAKAGEDFFGLPELIVGSEDEEGEKA